MEIILLFSILFIAVALGIPIGISLGLTTALTLFFTSDIPLMMISQNAFAALDSFPLMAIPFFMLAGSIMSVAGISKRLVKLADSITGFIIGGLSFVTILACMFFAAISGSGPATVSAIGSFMIPEMKEKKYDESFAAAIAAAAGSIGVIIPPSIPFVIYGVVAGVSIGEMFLSGIIPGIMIGIGLMGVSYIISKKRKYPKSDTKYTLKNILLNLKDSIWALFMPIIILGGIYRGIFTPTEAAVVADVYALIVGIFVYKELNFKKMYCAFREAALVNGCTTFMIGLSMSFARYLTMEQIPVKIARGMINLTESKILLLLLINLFLLIVGCFVDNISSMIILTPIFLPIIIKLGIDPIQFGLFMTVNLAIGFVTPPYGANLFVASAISGVKIEKISKEAVPFILIMIICLILFTFIPGLSMTLPQLLRK